MCAYVLTEKSLQLGPHPVLIFYPIHSPLADSTVAGHCRHLIKVILRLKSISETGDKIYIILQIVLLSLKSNNSYFFLPV